MHASEKMEKMCLLMLFHYLFATSCAMIGTIDFSESVLFLKN